MGIHKEGRTTLLIVIVLIVIANLITLRFTENNFIIYSVFAISALLYLFVRYFFRLVTRTVINDSNAIMAPCDGRVVVIENAFEDEFLKQDTIKVSIFMSPLNVHMNWFPVSGNVLYKQMHKGNHMAAWAPKSSTHNERSSVAIETPEKQLIMVRQIAGAVARRVVCYASKGQYADQNGNLGFIKFGSRVDLYLPSNAKVKVELNQKVTGTQTVIARFK